MAFTDEQIIKVAVAINHFFDISVHPNKNNDIKIENNTISLIKNGSVLISKTLDAISLKQQLEQITYTRNVFFNDDSKYSPLEADFNKDVWEQEYRFINLA